jgi:subtilisin family serine protease
LGLLDLIELSALMRQSRGANEITIGLLDGPVAMHHPDLASADIRELSSGTRARCSDGDSFACAHGTFIAGILCARRDSSAPAICPGCRMLVWPIFDEDMPDSRREPTARPEVVARGIFDCIEAGARVLNPSAALAESPTSTQPALQDMLNYAADRGVLVVAAAGNQGRMGSTTITRHPWVIPVAACDINGAPLQQSNLGRSIGQIGLRAPAEEVVSLSPTGAIVSGGTSVAAALVTGAIALVWSVLPRATASQIRLAMMTNVHVRRRTSVVPPLLNARAAHESLNIAVGRN